MEEVIYLRDLWYKNAVIYALDVETYRDSNGDGVGDFKGLTSQLDYLAGLGVTCLWLLPFYPTPNQDDGYDVTDFYGVDGRLGNLGDFVDFLHQAHERGLRVLIDFIPDHTSSQHPWFQEARRDSNSRYRDFYVWSKDKPENMQKGIVYPGEQEAVWTYDEEAKAYYHHFFFKFEPDLDLDNRGVREEVLKAMGYWLELGVSGFRLDSAPFMVWLRELDDPNVPRNYDYLQEMHNFLALRRGDSVLLAEVNLPSDKLSNYFGSGGRAQMIFNFTGSQHIFLSLARGQAAPLIEAMKGLPTPPQEGQYANFLRNHDEFNLERLSEQEQQEMFAAYAPDKDMQIYGSGIRRRIAPMLGGDRRCLELVYSVMFSLPGTPLLLYGEEIGMGDDLSLKGRLSVRTAMQWSSQKNGGFSSAPQEKLTRPVINSGEYHYQKVNVASQQHDESSMLNWMTRMIRMRKECPELGWGEVHILEANHPSLFAHACSFRDNMVLAVHNFSDKKASASLKLPGNRDGALMDLFSGKKLDLSNGKLEVELEGYGYRWFRLGDGSPTR